MIQGTADRHAGAPAGDVVLVCREPGRRALLERLLPAVRTHASAMEALLAVSRTPPRAVVLSLEDLEGGERDVVAALRRSRPETPVYVVVRPEDEPAGRGLVREGAGDYFVLPTDVYRLGRLFAPPAAKAPPPAPAPAPPRAEELNRQRLFETACALAGLASAGPQDLLRNGAAMILKALGAVRGCFFAWNGQAGRLELAAGVGGTPGAGAREFDDERAMAERAMRTGETPVLSVRSGAADARAGETLLCVPVRGGGETFGVFCLLRGADAPAGDEAKAAAALGTALARLYAAARTRELFARLARSK